MFIPAPCMYGGMSLIRHKMMFLTAHFGASIPNFEVSKKYQGLNEYRKNATNHTGHASDVSPKFIKD